MLKPGQRVSIAELQKEFDDQPEPDGFVESAIVMFQKVADYCHEQSIAMSPEMSLQIGALSAAIAQAEALERIAQALESISTDTDLLSDLVMDGNYLLVKTFQE